MLTDNELDLLIGLRAGIRSGRFRDIRERCGLTQAVIGEQIGVSAACVNHYENGRRMPRGETALRYVRLMERLGERVVAAEGRPGG